MRKVLSLLASVGLVVVVTACAEAVNTGADDPPLTANQQTEPTNPPSTPNTTPVAPPSSRDAGRDSGTTSQDSGVAQDAMPDVGPPPPDAATGGGGVCDMSSTAQVAIYSAKAISEIQKPTPRDCFNGCKQTECCFWGWQVCVDL
jgi:hypothetical protein